MFILIPLSKRLWFDHSGEQRSCTELSSLTQPVALVIMFLFSNIPLYIFTFIHPSLLLFCVKISGSTLTYFCCHHNIQCIVITHSECKRHVCFLSEQVKMKRKLKSNERDNGSGSPAIPTITYDSFDDGKDTIQDLQSGSTNNNLWSDPSNRLFCQFCVVFFYVSCSWVHWIEPLLWYASFHLSDLTEGTNIVRRFGEHQLVCIASCVLPSLTSHWSVWPFLHLCFDVVCLHSTEIFSSCRFLLQTFIDSFPSTYNLYIMKQSYPPYSKSPYTQRENKK